MELCASIAAVTDHRVRMHFIFSSLFFLVFTQNFYPATDTSGSGVLFSIDFFIYFFVSLLARLRENGWTDLHEIFREGME